MVIVTNKTFMLSVIMLSVIMLNVIMLNAIMLSVVLLNVVAPYDYIILVTLVFKNKFIQLFG